MWSSAGTALFSLPPPHRSRGDQDVSTLASRLAIKEGGSGGGIKMEGSGPKARTLPTLVAAGSPGQPSAPAASGSPTVAKLLSYFLSQPDEVLICLYTAAALPALLLLPSSLYTDPSSPDSSNQREGSEMKPGGALLLPHPPPPTVEKFMGTPRLDVGRSLERSGNRQEFSPALKAGLQSECGGFGCEETKSTVYNRSSEEWGRAHRTRSQFG